MARTRSLLPLLVAGLLVTGALVTSTAHADMLERCRLAALRVTGRLALKQLRCAATAAREGTPTDGTCLARAEEHFRKALARADARGRCDATAVADSLVGFVAAIVDDLSGTLDHSAGTDRCAARKLATTARQSLARLSCVQGIVQGLAQENASCVARSEEALGKAFRNAERRQACETVGDAPAIVDMLGTFALTVAAALNPTEAPVALLAAIAGADVELSWIPPSAISGNTHVKVLRRLNTPPVDADDPLADEIFFGTAHEGTDAVTDLLPDTSTTSRLYHYAAFGCTSGGSCEPNGSRTAIAPTLVEVLRAGGYVLHWRHSAADVCTDHQELGTAATTMVPDWWTSCDAHCPTPSTGTATARQLNATGVMEATALGETFDGLGISIGRVISSEYCRNFTTAELMDFGPPIELSQGITYWVYDEVNRCANSMALIAEVPAAGTNTALIGHAGFSCSILGSLAWSEAAIFKPDGMGGAEFIARLLWNQWPEP
jgi:phosphohistidine phosphatase SixA